MVHRTIEARSSAREADAERLAGQCGAKLAIGEVHQEEIRIVLFEDREEVWDSQSRRHGLPLSFQGIDLRTGSGNLSRKQPLGKAIGSTATTVVDATAGFGHDACLLACMGWHVRAIERDPFIACMLQIAAEDVQRHPELQSRIADRLTVEYGDAELLLETSHADVIYLDPMFTGRRRKSALPKKPAQLLQVLAEPSDDEKLLASARSAAHRVVVKRPSDIEPMGMSPDLMFEGRQIRYDVYLNPSID